jgi:hypothetical protein
LEVALIAFAAGATLGTGVGIFAAFLAAGRGGGRAGNAEAAARIARRAVADELTRIAGFLGTCLDAVGPDRAAGLARTIGLDPPRAGWEEHQAPLMVDLDDGAWHRLSVVFDEWAVVYDGLTAVDPETRIWPSHLRVAMEALHDEALAAREALERRRLAS